MKKLSLILVAVSMLFAVSARAQENPDSNTETTKTESHTKKHHRMSHKHKKHDKNKTNKSEEENKTE
jgi:Ni/Co efflux regulator RcnB